MLQIVLIGIAAGAASALLFASVASGSLISVLLFYLAPLPILIAAIGWSHVAGLVAALVAAGALAFGFGGLFFLAFLVGIGLPAWWLGYLALLARPAIAGGDLEWYPVGNLIVWAAILGGMVVTAVILTFGFDVEAFRTGLRQVFEQMLRAMWQVPPDKPLAIPDVSDPDRLLTLLVLIVPPMAGAITTVTKIVTLGLAAVIARVSGRLTRPWPDLSAMRFPPAAPVLLAAAVAATFLPGLMGVVGGVFAAGLLMAYGVLGFAVLHKITGRLTGRSFLLAGTYAAVLMLGWPILLMTVLGLADTALDIRSRIAARVPPPKPQT